jgi:signal transduction histidine kinase
MMGDLATLEQVFVNLIRNAVKYTSEQERAEISIGYLGDEEGKDPCTGELKQQRRNFLPPRLDRAPGRRC